MSLPDDLRAKAKIQAEGANLAFNAPDFPESATKQALAIIGQVNATTLNAVADAIDYLKLSVGQDSVIARRREVIERNDAIRRAAAKALSTGDWSEFDKLAAGFGLDPSAVTGGSAGGTSGANGTA